MSANVFEINPKDFKEAMTALCAIKPGEGVFRNTLVLTNGPWICFIISNGKTVMASIARSGHNPGNLAAKVAIRLPMTEETWQHIEDNEPVALSFDNGFSVSQYQWTYLYKSANIEYPITPPLFQVTQEYPTWVIPKDMLFRVYAEMAFQKPEGFITFTANPIDKTIVSDIQTGASIPVLEYYGPPTPSQFRMNICDIAVLDKLPDNKLTMVFSGPRILITSTDKAYKYLLKEGPI